MHWRRYVDGEPCTNAVQHAQRNRWHSEEVHRGDRVCVIPQERDPSLHLLRAGRLARHVARHRRLGHDEPELPQLAVDPRCTPTVVERHRTDQATNLRADPRPSGTAIALRKSRPVAPETFLVPLHHGVWLDDDQAASPAGPAGAQRNPEAAVSIVEPRSRPPLFQRGDLLAERQVLDHKVRA